MNEDTGVIYVTILQAIGFAENALVDIKRGDTSTALSDISNAGMCLETAKDLLSRQAPSPGCEWSHTPAKASERTNASFNPGLSAISHS